MEIKLPPGIPGRSDLFRYIDDLIGQPNRGDSLFSVFYIKLHNLRELTNTHGFSASNSLLLTLHQRLKDMGKMISYTAQVGDSEFGVVMSPAFNNGHAALAISKILRELRQPVELGEETVSINVTVGAAMFPEDGGMAESLMQCASLALDGAVATGESFGFYTSGLMSDQLTGWKMEVDIKSAIENDEFSLHYQPKFDLASGRVTGAEALLRWKRPDGQNVSPQIAIEVAEKAGCMGELTWWVLNTAMRESAAWKASGYDISVAVNVSRSMLHSKEFADNILSARNIWGSSTNITIEVTENALMEEAELSYETLRYLRRNSIDISIDDFGTGYSSFADFKFIPANEIKIDKSFVMRMQNNEIDRHIVSTIIYMAHGFGLTVVAEGVEDQQTFDDLLTLECDAGQGFLMAHPMPQEELLKWLDAYHNLPKRAGESE